MKNKTNISELQQITVILNYEKEDMERMLQSSHLRIHGVLYDIPFTQLQKNLNEKKYGKIQYRLTKSKDQDSKH